MFDFTGLSIIGAWRKKGWNRNRGNILENRDREEGLGEASVRKVLITQAFGPQIEPQNPQRNPETVMHVKFQDLGSRDRQWPSGQTASLSEPEANERTYLENQSRRHPRMT